LRAPFLINWSRLPIQVEIAARADLECAGDAAAEPDVALDSPRALRLDSAEIVALVPDAADAGVADSSACGAASVRVEDGPAVEVGWGPGVSRDRTLVLEPIGRRDEQRWAIGGHLHVPEAYDNSITVAGSMRDLKFVLTGLERRR